MEFSSALETLVRNASAVGTLQLTHRALTETLLLSDGFPLGGGEAVLEVLSVPGIEADAACVVECGD